MPVTAIARLTGVSAAYDDRAVLHDVNFALYSGEVVAILGANGPQSPAGATIL